MGASLYYASVDDQGPVTTNVAIAPVTTNESLTTTLSFTLTEPMPGSTIVSAEYFFDHNDPGEGSGYAIPITATAGPTNVTVTVSSALLAALSEGNHTVCVRGEDVYGNWGEENCAWFTIDRSGLIVVIEAPSEGEIFATDAVTATGFAFDSTSEISSITYYLSGTTSISGSVATPVDGSYDELTEEFSIPLTGLSDDDSYVLSVSALDSAQNAATGTVNFVVDTTVPSISWTSVPTAIVTSTHLILEGRATDATTNITYVKWRYQHQGVWTDWVDAGGDGGNKIIGNSRTELFSVDLVDLFDGSYRLQVVAIDAAGNKTGASVYQIFFTVDTTGPDTTNVTVSPVTTNESLTTVLSADITDAITDVVTAEFFIDGPDPGEGSAYTVPVSPVSTSVSMATDITGYLAALSEGQHIIYVRGQDVVGNWGPLNWAWFTVDRSDLIVVIEAPSEAEIFATDAVTATGFVFDSTSEISSITYYLTEITNFIKT